MSHTQLQQPARGLMPFPPIAAIARRMLAVPLLWCRRIRYRRELAGLTAAQLRDAGLAPAMVLRESLKPFWRA